MRIKSVCSKPSYEFRYKSAAPRGGSEGLSLWLQAGSVDGLGAGLEGLLVMSDLQGVAASWQTQGQTRLVGEVVAEQLGMLWEAGLIPPPSRLGVVLAGDLYSTPEATKRGASGDVRSVWEAFRNSARWVVGVAGNHDLFGSERDQARFARMEGIHLLDGRTVHLDGLTIGGIGGIVGDPQRQGRRDPDWYLEALERVVGEGPDILVLHEGPSTPDGRKGSADLRSYLEEQARNGMVVVCGHTHWNDSLGELGNGTQVLNVDGRVVLLAG